MKYNILGRTGLRVSKLCFGALTIGPLQANLPLQTGAKVMMKAFEAGVNFIDTAQLYQTYAYIREALVGRKNDIIISSKSYAYTYEDMKKSVEQACRSVNREYIDIFMLHEQTSRLTLRGHQEALEYLLDAKKEGIIRAVGVSTHTVEVVRAAALMDEIDVIHPILNMKGIGICDGDTEDMLSAIEFAHYMGKGIYTMKALGGGHLSLNAREAFEWILAQPNIHAVAIGMQTLDEVALNCNVFAQGFFDTELAKAVAAQKRTLLIEDWCTGCGTCVERCQMNALTIRGGHAVANMDRCVLCGYCGASCPEFCIKII